MLNQIQTGFYNLISTCTTAVYNVLAPQTVSFPYITFGLLTEIPIGDFEDFEAVENLTYYVNCFSSKSIIDVSDIADEVMNNLDGQTLTVSGYTSLKCVREFIGSIIYEPEIGIYQIPLRYRIWLDKS